MFKIDEEDYLYLKKAHGSDKAVETPTKYKVLAIANEAPDYIKVNRQSLGKLSHNSADSELLFNDYTFMPIKSKSVFRVNTNIIESSGYAKIEELDKLEMILSDPSNNDFSDRYEITSAVKDQLNPSGYIITIQGVFGTDVNFIEDTTSTASIPVIKDGVVLEITGGKIENKPEFDGKFFVKINKEFSITIDDDQVITANGEEIIKMPDGSLTTVFHHLKNSDLEIEQVLNSTKLEGIEASLKLELTQRLKKYPLKKI